MTTKRERGCNFTREESDILIKLVNDNKHILENKKSDAATWAEKEQCWQRIESKFNSISSVGFRSAKALKIKYDGIKRDTRRKSAAIQAEIYRAGEGMDSIFDSEQISVLESPEQKFIPILPQDSRLFDDTPVIGDNIEKLNETPLIHEPKKVISSHTSTNVSCDNKEKTKIREFKNLVDTDTAKPITKWSQWKPTSLRAKKHPILCKQKPMRPFEKVAESKLEIASIQKQLIQEELEHKRKQWLFEEEEWEHKRAIWALEKQWLQNKIDKNL